MLKEYLESFKNDNKLVNAVMDYYIDRYGEDDMPDELYQSMEDLLHYGCQSGMIGCMIYYSDTTKFYEDYKEEINELLKDALDSTGCSLPELFGDKYDKEDPLHLEDYNKNLFAWFGFEETARSLYEQMQERKYEKSNDDIEEEQEEIEAEI